MAAHKRAEANHQSPTQVDGVTVYPWEQSLTEVDGVKMYPWELQASSKDSSSIQMSQRGAWSRS